MIKVLWFDDEFRDFESFIDDAEDRGIELVGYNNAEEGIAELKLNFKKYDAVVLDGYFYDKKDSTGDELSDTALGKVCKELALLKQRNIVIPWFIFTGKIKKIDQHTNSIISVFADKEFAEGKIFEKNDKDFLRLCKEIKIHVEKQAITKLKNKHSDFFDIFSKSTFNSAHEETFVEILLSFEKPNWEFTDKLYFSELRIVIEEMFRIANKKGLLHDKCINYKGEVNLIESTSFLAGEETKYLGIICKKKHFPKIIAEAVKSVLFITGAAAHTASKVHDKNINLEEYRKIIKTPYLLYSLTFQIMDILIWFDEYSSQNTCIKTNKSYWQALEFDNDGKKYFTGIVDRIADNGWGTIKIDEEPYKVSIHKEVVKNKSIKEMDHIKFSIDTKHYTKDIKEVKSV